MSDMSEIIKESLDGIKVFADPKKIIGDVIQTPSGVTIIPISKLTVGFAGGGADFGQKKLSHTQNFGCASGTGVSVTPIAFLTVTPDSTVNLITVNDEKTASDRFITMIERSPEIIERIKNVMS
jgi:sporulation protein YtfJ